MILMPKIAEPIDQPVKIVASLTLPDKRKRDGNNMLASVYDLLVDCRILEDDNVFIIAQEQLSYRYKKGEALLSLQIFTL